ncbi:protocadherin-15-like isoform X3 [Apostichopus japonicus]|uniref:protocadherin-15-like isoform X3 n=1 Tax=Stichopus japonicus TaxID=307972 RepID=UPI003AB830AF
MNARIQLGSNLMSNTFVAIIILCSSFTCQGQEINVCSRNDGSDDEFLIFNIDEESLPGTSIGYLPFEGFAGENDPNISLSLKEGFEDNKYVYIDAELSLLRLTDTIDSDIMSRVEQLRVDVNCEPLTGEDTRELSYTVYVEVNDINDNAPQFVNPPYGFSLSELSEPNTVVFSGVKAEDADANGNGQILYSVLQNPNDPESVEHFAFLTSGTPELSLIMKLDYESKQSWEVLVEARDNPQGSSPNRNTTMITVTVLDDNDFGPFFLPCMFDESSVGCIDFNYVSNITEKMVLDGPLVFGPGPIHAMDGDENVTVSEQIFFNFTEGEPANYAEYFEIDSISGNVSQLKPVRHSEIPEFRITLQATEGISPDALYSTIDVIISVKEINNFEPEFASTVFSGFIQEGADAGTPVWDSPSMNSALVLQATDPDLEEDEVFRVSYMLNDPSGTFILAADTQSKTEIVVNGMIDREMVEKYELKMVAMESSTSAQFVSESVTVNITVLDVNDNAPYFIQNKYSVGRNQYGTTIRQNLKAGTVIMELQVADVDTKPRIADYTYILRLLTPFSGTSPFAEMSMNSLVKIVLVEDAIEIPKGDYVLGLQASDVDNPFLLSLEITLGIKVIGENDTEGPVFVQKEFIRYASEGTQVGSVIAEIKANQTNRLPILYSFTSNDGFFTIDPTSGGIRLAKELDRETQSQHIVIVQAESGGKVDTADVIIHVLDVNDNSPQLNSSAPAVFLIVEGQPDDFIGQISAFDPDEQGRPNSEVWFSMDSEYFKISATSGSISTTDRVLFVDDVERLEVEVTLHDRGTPPMSSDVTIVIIIQDVEDFSPVFEYLEYTASIQENYVALNFLMLRVLNRNASATSEFYILEGDESIFHLNYQTGSLSLKSTLNYEAKNSFYLEVVVIDGFNNTDLANISVYVMDENDNAPQFNQSVYEGVYEPDAPSGTEVVMHIEAFDLDKQGTDNSLVVYHLEPSLGIFQLRSDLSTPVIITSVHLNFTQETYMLTIIAVDSGIPPLSSTADVIIRPRLIQPIFEENPIRVTSLFEGEPADSLVTKIKARANVGDLVTYSIISGNAGNVFLMTSVDNMGFIYTTKELDRELQSLYVLEILAEIQSSESQTSMKRRKRALDPSIAKVMIEVGDINDNPPSFSADVYYAGVSLTATKGSLVTQLRTTDLDTEVGEVVYRSSAVPSAMDSKFRILESSGVVVTTAAFNNNESDLTYRLIITAEDQSSEQLQTTSTTLLISVINSTNRIIISLNLSTSIVEEQRGQLEAELSMLFSAHAFVEDVIQRRTGQDYQEIDPSGSDVLIFVLEDSTARPWQNNDTIGMLLARRQQLDDISVRLLPDGEILEIRKPVDVDSGMIVVNRPYAPEGVLLLIIAVIIFILTVMACVIILISWKKRETEREENRIYLPMQYSTFNPYKQSTEDLEMMRATEAIDGTARSVSNPVFFEDNNSLHTEATSQVEVYPNGAATHVKEKEVQEYAIDFGPEDEEATAVAKSIIQAGVLDTVPDDGSDVPGQSTPPMHIGTTDYQHSSSQEPLITPGSPDDQQSYQEADCPLPPPPDFSLPHVPEQPSRKAPSPPLRDYSNQGTLPADTILPSYKAYDNLGMNLSDEGLQETAVGDNGETNHPNLSS